VRWIISGRLETQHLEAILAAAAPQQDDWIRRWLKRQYEDALAAPLSPRLATLITQLERQDVSA